MPARSMQFCVNNYISLIKWIKINAQPNPRWGNQKLWVKFVVNRFSLRTQFLFLWFFFKWSLYRGSKFKTLLFKKQYLGNMYFLIIFFTVSTFKFQIALFFEFTLICTNKSKMQKISIKIKSIWVKCIVTINSHHIYFEYFLGVAWINYISSLNQVQDSIWCLGLL